MDPCRKTGSSKTLFNFIKSIKHLPEITDDILDYLWNIIITIYSILFTIRLRWQYSSTIKRYRRFLCILIYQHHDTSCKMFVNIILSYFIGTRMYQFIFFVNLIGNFETTIHTFRSGNLFLNYFLIFRRGLTPLPHSTPAFAPEYNKNTIHHNCLLIYSYLCI